MNRSHPYFPPVTESPALQQLRQDVRAFLDERLGREPRARRPLTYLGRHDPAFSEDLASCGWVGMSIPREYGGRAASVLERHAVFEELIAARAPIGAHSTADRQSGPLIVRLGTEWQKRKILPAIAAGKCYFCIGMSEPNSGSDLASVKTRARRTEGGWLIDGTKLWTSSAHRSHYMMLLCRTRDADSRHEGLSQFILDMQTPGISCRPFANMAGEIDFNEVLLKDVFVPDAMLLGKEGNGWAQVTSELAFERSGPERFLSGLALLEALVDGGQGSPADNVPFAVGRMVAHLHTLRSMSRSVAAMLQEGAEPSLQAAIVKNLGTGFEQEVAEMSRLALPAEPDRDAMDDYARTIAETLLRAPSCTIRGGTREIMRNIIARSLYQR